MPEKKEQAKNVIDEADKFIVVAERSDGTGTTVDNDLRYSEVYGLLSLGLRLLDHNLEETLFFNNHEGGESYE